MTLFNFLIENDLIFFSMFSGTVGLIGYSFVTNYLHSTSVKDKGIQTDA
jgi:hypothetical protein